MRFSSKPTAEEKFAATQKKAERALSEMEKEQERKKELTARLRNLRLAKEAVGKRTAMKAVIKSRSR